MAAMFAFGCVALWRSRIALRTLRRWASIVMAVTNRLTTIGRAGIRWEDAARLRCLLRWRARCPVCSKSHRAVVGTLQQRIQTLLATKQWVWRVKTARRRQAMRQKEAFVRVQYGVERGLSAWRGYAHQLIVFINKCRAANARWLFASLLKGFEIWGLCAGTEAVAYAGRYWLRFHVIRAFSALAHWSRQTRHADKLARQWHDGQLEAALHRWALFRRSVARPRLLQFITLRTSAVTFCRPPSQPPPSILPSPHNLASLL